MIPHFTVTIPSLQPITQGGEHYFVPAKKFAGTFPGYAFKMGKAGLGYYQDAAQKGVCCTAWKWMG